MCLSSKVDVSASHASSNTIVPPWLNFELQRLVSGTGKTEWSKKVPDTIRASKVLVSSRVEVSKPDYDTDVVNFKLHLRARHGSGGADRPTTTCVDRPLADGQPLSEHNKRSDSDDNWYDAEENQHSAAEDYD